MDCFYIQKHFVLFSSLLFFIINLYPLNVSKSWRCNMLGLVNSDKYYMLGPRSNGGDWGPSPKGRVQGAPLFCRVLLSFYDHGKNHNSHGHNPIWSEPHKSLCLCVWFLWFVLYFLFGILCLIDPVRKSRFPNTTGVLCDFKYSSQFPNVLSHPVSSLQMKIFHSDITWKYSAFLSPTTISMSF